MISTSTDSRGYSVAFVGLTLLLCRNGESEPPRAAKPPSAEPPSLADLSDADLMLRFASIGDNCEFGMVQRACGAEPMDLLRFTGLAGPRHAGLVRGLETCFAGVERIEDLEFELHPASHGREYVLHQRCYDFQSHTTILEGSTTVERLFRREHKKLGLLRRLFEADVLSAERIFVYKRNDTVPVEFVRPIVERLRGSAPNTVLFVTRTDDAARHGTVEQHGEGLLVGYIDRFNPYSNAMAPASELWRPICRGAYDIWRNDRLAPVRARRRLGRAARS